LNCLAYNKDMNKELPPRGDHEAIDKIVHNLPALVMSNLQKISEHTGLSVSEIKASLRRMFNNFDALISNNF